MKAAVYYAPGDIRVENRPEPAAKDDNLIVKVKCCSICGTDIKIATIGNPRCHPPRIIGHEMVGQIIHAGSGTKGFAAGERVTLATTVSCGKCRYCTRGLGNICPDAKPVSYDFDGAFAQRMEIPSMALTGGNVIKVPESVTDEAAALSEPLSCALNAQEIAGVKEGGRVLIVGDGPLGVLHAELLKASGVKDIAILARNVKRVELLRKIKNIYLIDTNAVDTGTAINEWTEGLGADVVIVCAPTRDAHEKSLNYVRKGGTVSFFASLPKEAPEITINSRTVHYGELRITGASDSRPEHVEKVVRLLAQGKIATDSIITHKIPLENIHTGFELMKNRDSLKVMVYPGGIE